MEDDKLHCVLHRCVSSYYFLKAKFLVWVPFGHDRTIRINFFQKLTLIHFFVMLGVAQLQKLILQNLIILTI